LFKSYVDDQSWSSNSSVFLKVLSKIGYNVTTVTFMTTWILLNYKLPTHPTALRVYVWRKLKRLGSVLLNDAIWILPDSPRTLENFQWLAAEIQEMKGNVSVWRSDLVLGFPEDTLIGQFHAQVNKEYKELLKKLGKKNPDLPRLSQEYQQIVVRDYFRSEVGKQVKERFLVLRGETE
jgi:uncharacterized protein Usg